MAGDIEYVAKTVTVEKIKLAVTVIVAIGLAVALYVGYSKIEGLFAKERAYMEGVIDTKLAAVDADIGKRLDNIKVINEHKTITYKQVTTIYQSSQKEMADLEALKNKPLADIVAAWNNTL